MKTLPKSIAPFLRFPEQTGQFKKGADQFTGEISIFYATILLNTEKSTL